MSKEAAAWLEATASELRGQCQDEIDVEGLVKSYGIEIQLDFGEKPSGLLIHGKDKKWTIVVRGRRNKSFWTPSDRFTVAHELAHYFLINEWGISPSLANKREYYDCEDVCNRFAAHLLVDYTRVAMAEIKSPEECLGWVRRISEIFNVSKEVAARSIVETHVGLGICGYSRAVLGWYRLWGLSSLNGFRKSNRKSTVTTSIEEEMFTWAKKQLGMRSRNPKLRFASEAIGIWLQNTNQQETATNLPVRKKFELAAIALPITAPH